LSDYLLVITTLPDAAAAHAMAELLVRNKLAACVNVGAPVTSVYTWQDQVQQDPEVMLTIKTRSARFDALRDAIVAAHPYELPEVIAVPITAGHPAYLAWIDTCTTD
jgi:periplasmic divalent cation tolerance protein